MKKLFIWNDPFDVDYGGCCLYVVASNIEEARGIAARAGISEFGHPPREQKVGSEKAARLGEPSRILDAPCGELYYWQE